MPARFFAALFLAACLVAPPASAKVFGDLPDVIVCPIKAVPSRPGGDVVFYVDVRFEDGTVDFKALGQGALLLKVTAQGVVQAKRIEGCDGKSVGQLREAGRAFDFR